MHLTGALQESDLSCPKSWQCRSDMGGVAGNLLDRQVEAEKASNPVRALRSHSFPTPTTVLPSPDYPYNSTQQSFERPSLSPSSLWLRRLREEAVLCLLLAQVAEAATYTVGDTRGWSFNTDSWPRGKRFRAGDVVGEDFTSGKDRVTLARGRNYFICNTVGHCQSGMKLAIVAA
ncbi:hypothetical protein B296_00026122 [Ensete ventricosum]|uniref:Phytocyanin domain-containing protein n=1 Tax=Ensete ventricosum TaxID=4639 RepID=A0A427ABH3_ENSVE|nr:hypothetical protein B296_00026122 [Ensete ventricosum]